ncbi:unnamed protein product [Vitrella brassicaformis CCMP3155]|uniref:Tubulin--tyrosine ligase-like protein 9 n=1 Tax=Vitrella brassicaformis (strain CCMP3155) TaxID=1169540 RepID=A0A0G4FPW3_VITBC|nr:unnamed protein product [Vitrella brassicaformis CCMP3155]|eukprot:CEM16485.1 unnamed protein product [Vitrella brassicaformis CCMP3155]
MTDGGEGASAGAKEVDSMSHNSSEGRLPLYIHSGACNYRHDLVERCFSKRASQMLRAPPDMRPSDPDVKLQWAEYELICWERVLKGELVCNAYPLRKNLIRKANLARCLNKYISKTPKSPLARAVPESVIISMDDDPSLLHWSLADARDAMERPFAAEGGMFAANRWILKPSMLDRAEELTILSSYDELTDIVQANPEIQEWVLQRYLDHPLLIQHGRKFHLRAYVVAVGSLHVWVLDELLAHVAARPYPMHDLTQLGLLGHITNLAYGERDPLGYDVTRHMRPFFDDCMRHKEIRPEAAQAVFDRIKALVAETFRAVRGEFLGFTALPNCFELFAFDFLVDTQHQPYLLEVNAWPDVTVTGPHVRGMVADLTEGIFRVAVDRLLGGGGISLGEGCVVGKLHCVLSDSGPQWGAPNMAFVDTD